MVRRIKLAVCITTFLIIFLPSFTLAQDVYFSIFPAEVRINNLTPGDVAQFELTVHNKDEIAHNFTFATFQPTEEQRKEGWAEFPDDSWISFSSPEIEVTANSEANVTVTVSMPQEQKCAGEDWETWLGVASESSALLTVKLYVRLLVSTGGHKSNIGLVVVIVVVIILTFYCGYRYFKRKAKLK
jgi:hypothetical protein